MKKKIVLKICDKRVFIIFIGIVILILFIFLIFYKKNNDLDTVLYQGEKYVYLEYNMDIFNYNFNSDNYYEVDKIYPISHDKWDMIYLSGDLFVHHTEISKAKAYYSDDDNYDWYFVLDVDDSQVEYPISISDDELDYLYSMDDMKKEETMLFEEIKEFGEIKKVSKDGTISSIICLAYYNDAWYFRTEIIDVDKENDPEYVIRLSDSLNNKIFSLLDR